MLGPSPGRVPSVRSAAKRAAATAGLGLFRPLRDEVRRRRQGHPVRIFTFHRISSHFRDPLTVDAKALRQRVAYVQRYHDIVDLDSAIGLLAEGANLIRPAAVLTFDDGYRSVLTRAAPVLDELGVPACCFVCTAMVGADQVLPHDTRLPYSEDLRLLDWDEVQKLVEAGWTIGAHTASHARLSELEGAELQRELELPLQVLRSRLGARNLALAYPYGGVADISIEAVRLAERLGYSSCLSNYGGENLSRAGFKLLRIDIGGDLPEEIWKLWSHGMSLRPRPTAGDTAPGDSVVWKPTKA